MSRHNTPGTIKIGNTVVQTGGGAYTPGGVTSVTPQRRILKTKEEIPDDRERFIANQAQKAANQQAQDLINLANRRSDVETALRFAPETVDRSDFTGFTGGVLGLRTGDFQDTGIPKLREGLSSDEYANYMRGLSSINPQKMETMFPVASGKALTPLIARLLESGVAKDASNLVRNVGLDSFIDSATGAMFKPRGGTVRPSDISTGDMGFGIGSPEIAPKMQTPLFANVPDQFREGFLDFYNKYEGPKAGGMAITPVKLPDGSVIEFGDTGSARIFREYLESIGVKIDPDTGQDIKQVESQPTTISNFDVDKFYASLPQYTQQGIMSPNLAQFNQNLRMFPGMA
jgi:hypothetical protein